MQKALEKALVYTSVLLSPITSDEVTVLFHIIFDRKEE